MHTISHDQAAQEDLLNRDKFATHIANTLATYFKTYHESIVVGITGSWGSGKSTLLSFIEGHLRQIHASNSEEIHISFFNPWATAFLDTEDLQRTFLETIITELENLPLKNKLEKGSATFKSYLKYLNYLKWVKHIHPIAGNVMSAIEEYTSQAKVHSLEEVRFQADKILQENNARLYIFVDDLDRLSNDEIAIIFKTIKLNLSFKNTCFVIAYDKLVVSSALQKQFHNGQAYLEKIVQADFAVPEILEEEMENLFFSEMKKSLIYANLAIEDSELFIVWKYYGLKEYFKNLRDLKRYFNSLLLSLPNIGQEVNLVDFITLEAIKVFDYPAFASLYDDFQMVQRRNINGKTTIDHTIIDKYSNQKTKDLLRYLFLQNEYDLQINYATLNDKRLRHPDYFQRYYSWFLPSKDSSEESIRQFFQFPASRLDTLQQIVKQGKTLNFLRRLGEARLSKHYPVTDFNILDVIIKYGDNNEEFITEENREPIWQAYFNIAHSYDDKFLAAKQAFSNLILQESQHQPLRLAFNHMIFSSGKSNPKIHGEIEKQFDLLNDDLFKAFITHMNKMWHNYFWRAIHGRKPFIAKMFFASFAQHMHDSYIKNLSSDQYLQNTSLCLFFIKQFFVLTDEVGEPYNIDTSRKDLLLPGNTWLYFIDTLKGAKPGSWNAADTKLVDYFLDKIGQDRI